MPGFHGSNYLIWFDNFLWQYRLVSSGSRKESVFGKILAILAMIVFSVFLGFARYVAWKVI